MDSITSFPLTSLLRVSWLAATLTILAASVPLKPLYPLRRLLSAFAARGKTQNPNSRKLLTVPQRFFLHFYVVAVAITTVLLVCSWSYAYSEMLPLAEESLGLADVTSNLAGGSRILFGKGRGIASVAEKLRVWRSVFVLVLMEAQVMRRLYETRVVFDYGPSARMHLLGYFSGLFFYIAAPLSLASACALEVLSYAGGQIAEFIVKGRERMPVMEFSWWDLLKPLISLGWCQWIGSAIFIWGWIHQFRCHAILGSLREHKGTDEYVIPHGDWFKYVSCPHYLAEIVIYTGILVASGGTDITIWLLLFFVIGNLVFAAAETHKWYRCKFDSYPQSRRAIIPFAY